MENLEENLKILLEKEIRKKPILKKGCVQDLFNIIFYMHILIIKYLLNAYFKYLFSHSLSI